MLRVACVTAICFEACGKQNIGSSYCEHHGERPRRVAQGLHHLVVAHVVHNHPVDLAHYRTAVVTAFVRQRKAEEKAISAAKTVAKRRKREAVASYPAPSFGFNPAPWLFGMTCGSRTAVNGSETTMKGSVATEDLRRKTVNI